MIPAKPGTFIPVFVSRSPESKMDSEESSNLAGLLDNLNMDNWFEMLSIISDAVREMDWIFGDIVDWVIRNQIRPRELKSHGSPGEWFSWSRVKGLDGLQKGFPPCYTSCGVALVELLTMISDSKPFMKRVEEEKTPG